MATFQTSVKTNNGRSTYTLRVVMEPHSKDENNNSSKVSLKMYLDLAGYDNFSHRSNIYLRVGSDVLIDTTRNVDSIQNGTIELYSHGNLHYGHGESGDLSLNVQASFETVQKGLSYLPSSEMSINTTYHGPKINRSVRVVRELGTVYLWHPLDTSINGKDSIYCTVEKTNSSQWIEAWWKVGNEYWEAMTGRSIQQVPYNSNQYWIIFWDEDRKKMAERARNYEGFPSAQLSIRTHNPGGGHVDTNYTIYVGYLNPEYAIPQIYSVWLDPDIDIPYNHYVQQAANYNIKFHAADANTSKSDYPSVRNYTWGGRTSIYKNMSDSDMEWCLKNYVGSHTKYNYDMRGPNGENWNGEHDTSSIFNKDTLYHRFLNNGTYTMKIWTKNARSSTLKDINNRTLTVLPYSKPIINNLQAVRNGAKLDKEIIITYGFRWYKVHTLQRINATILVLEKDTGSQVFSQNVLLDAQPSSETISSRLNAAGTFQLNREYIVKLNVRDMSNDIVSLSQTVPVDQIIAYVGKSGVGVGKQHELGALDVKGDIYANGRKVQQYALTQDNGYVTRLYSTTNGSGDEYRTPGQYWVQVSDGGMQWALLEVFKSMDNEIVQRFTILSTGRVWYRVSDYNTGKWLKWYHVDMVKH